MTLQQGSNGGPELGSGSSIEVEPASPGDVQALGQLFGRAFLEDPLARFYEPDVQKRRAILPPHFTALIGSYIRDPMPASVHAWVTLARDAAVIWTDYEFEPSDPEQAMRQILAPLGEAATKLTRVFEIVDGHAPSAPHDTLQLVGTDPQQQRRGRASAVLAPGFERCDARERGAYLWTVEKVVPFYQRRRFEVVWSEQLPDGPRLCGMWRNPSR